MMYVVWTVKAEGLGCVPLARSASKPVPGVQAGLAVLGFTQQAQAGRRRAPVC